MVSGKGILYTVLGASVAAVAVGTMLTGGARGQKLRKFGNGLQNFIGKFNRKPSLSNPSSSSTYDKQIGEMGSMGHS